MNECEMTAGRWYFQRAKPTEEEPWDGRLGAERICLYQHLTEISDYNRRHPAAPLQIDQLTFPQL